MINKLIIVSTLLITLGSAQKKPSQKILSKDQMVKILIDLHIAEVRASRDSNNKDAANMLLKETLFSICKAHGIEQKAFQKSYHYYLAHPREMAKIYESVVDELSLKECLAK